MLATLKAMWARVVGGGRETRETAHPAVEYKGYRIRPAPYAAKGQYQTAGVIEKNTESGVKEHRFIRAETHASAEDAAAFAIAKGKQIIDQQGDRIFNEP
jgi:hypothetical protein